MTTRRDISSKRDGNDKNQDQNTQNRRSAPLQTGKNIREGTGKVSLPNTPGTGMEAFHNALSRYQLGETPSKTSQDTNEIRTGIESISNLILSHRGKD